jgi:hypothetical protein
MDDGRNGNITYNIIGGNEGGAFKIEPIYSGIVKVKYPVDFEIKEKYQLTIEAKDGGSQSTPSVCQLVIDITDINDQPPNFPETKLVLLDSRSRFLASLIFPLNLSIVKTLSGFP